MPLVVYYADLPFRLHANLITCTMNYGYALLPHIKRVLGLIPGWGRSFSV